MLGTKKVFAYFKAFLPLREGERKREREEEEEKEKRRKGEFARKKKKMESFLYGRMP